MNALSQLSYLPETKDQIESFVEQAKNEILDGNVNVKDIFVKFKCIEETIKAIKSDPKINNLLIEEVESDGYNKNAELSLSGKRTWDFSSDPIYNAKKAELKAREILLKGTKGVDPETGEVVGIEKYSEFVKISLK